MLKVSELFGFNVQLTPFEVFALIDKYDKTIQNKVNLECNSGIIIMYNIIEINILIIMFEQCRSFSKRG